MSPDTPPDASTMAEALVPRFRFERSLNQDQAGRRTALYGSINSQPALLILERAPFPSSPGYLASVTATLRTLKNLGANDIYYWYLANGGHPAAGETGSNNESNEDGGGDEPYKLADLKINLIYPCTEQHIKKYSKQGVRFVTETPEVYRDKIRPLMLAKREEGRLNWVFNIIEGRKEAEDVIYRTPLGGDATHPVEEGFLLLPDLNWDRRTVEALHLLGVVERRDIWSLRDLRKRHVPWLRRMRRKLIDATVSVYGGGGTKPGGTKPRPGAGDGKDKGGGGGGGVEEDQLKLYVHYQPTYYHFHVHIVHVQLEAGATQATGKAVGLEAIIEQLEGMAGGEDVGMDSVALSYTLGEASELWVDVFEPLKRGRVGL